MTGLCVNHANKVLLNINTTCFSILVPEKESDFSYSI
jgi:hypothetical protein